MSSNDAIEYLRSKIPQVLDMAIDGAWDVLQDFWEDQLHAVGYQLNQHEDARIFVRHLQDIVNQMGTDDLDYNIRSWVNGTAREMRDWESR